LPERACADATYDSVVHGLCTSPPTREHLGPVFMALQQDFDRQVVPEVEIASHELNISAVALAGS
jgi:hypothetical protein